MSGVDDRLRWRTRAIGCLLPLLAVATVLFGIAAFSPALFDELAGGRRGQWIEWTSAVTVAGVNLPLALLTLYLLWETFRSAWRWADEVAVRITEEVIVPHGSLFMRPVPWSAIADVRVVQLPSARALTPALLIELRDGRRHRIKGIDNENAAAERFAAAARTRLERPAA